MEKDLEEYNRKLKKLDKLLKEREMRDDRVGSASTSGTFSYSNWVIFKCRLADRRRRDRARRSASKTRSGSISDRNRIGSGRINSGRSNRDLSSAKSRGKSHENL